MTKSFDSLNIMIAISIVLLFVLAFYLWSNTPQLFEYFNQAFCAHGLTASIYLKVFKIERY